MWGAIESISVTILCVSVIMWLWSSREAVKAFLKGYATEKGKNLATHEDIERVLDQVRAVTSTTEQIKAKISNDVWDRQRRWEMKRDILFETGRKISADYSAFSNALPFFNQEMPAKMEKPALDRKRVEVMTDFHKASLEVDGMFALVGVVCAEDVAKQIYSFSQDVRTTMLAVRRADRESDDAIFARLGPKYTDVIRILRRELEANPVAMPSPLNLR